jgi:hypothetical protein
VVFARERATRLERFLAGALVDADRDLDADAPLMKKALLPGPLVYGATWPLWHARGATHWFFDLIRGWALSERMAQHHRLWPDGLAWMAATHRLGAANARVAAPPSLEGAPAPHLPRTSPRTATRPDARA